MGIRVKFGFALEPDGNKLPNHRLGWLSMKAELNTRENAAKAAATFCPGVASETAEAADPDVRLLVLGQLSTADRTVIKAQRVASRVRSNSASCSWGLRRAEVSDSQKDAPCKGGGLSSSARWALPAFAVSTASSRGRSGRMAYQNHCSITAQSAIRDRTKHGRA